MSAPDAPAQIRQSRLVWRSDPEPIKISRQRAQQPHVQYMVWPDLVVLLEPDIDRDLRLFGAVEARN
jgi:hypothetical protein